MSERVRIVTPREDAVERDFRRQVSEAIREVARALAAGIGIAGLRVQPVALTVEGDDVDVDILIDATLIPRTHPWGVVCGYVRHLASGAPGSLGGSVQWTYRTQGKEAFVRIQNFAGLAAGEKYEIRLLIFGGE